MTKHLVTCDCGQQMAVDVGQAGQKVSCSCGAEVEVPSFREIRQLPPAKEVSEAKHARQPANWSILRGLFFAFGLGLTVFGVGYAGYFQFFRMRLSTVDAPWDDLDGALKAIDEISLVQATEALNVFEKVGVGPYDPPQFIVNRIWASRWLVLVKIGVSVAAAGALLLGISYLIPRPSQSGRRGPPARQR